MFTENKKENILFTLGLTEGENNSVTIIYSPNHVKCSRPLCSLRGLQDQKPMSHYYFTFWNSTISDLLKFLWDQLVLSYSTHGSQKSPRNQKKMDFQA